LLLDTHAFRWVDELELEGSPAATTSAHSGGVVQLWAVA
jgi:hypothetical protein